MESRNKILKSLLLVLLLLGLLISLFFYFKSSNTNVNDTKESPQEIIKPKLIAVSNEVTKTGLDSFFRILSRRSTVIKQKILINL